MSPDVLDRIIRRHAPRDRRWICQWCAEPWPCGRYRAIPVAVFDVDALTRAMLRRLALAIGDHRDREGPFAPRPLVRRFLWFLPLTDQDVDEIIEYARKHPASGAAT